MSQGINKAIIVGNLGADPDLRHTGTGKAVCNLSIATSEQWTDRDGNRQESTQWHKVNVWDRAAEACDRYLSKGSQVYVEGSIQYRTYTDRDGVERKVTEIRAARVLFLSGGSGGGGGGRGGYDEPPPHNPPPRDDDGTDDIPF